MFLRSSEPGEHDLPTLVEYSEYTTVADHLAPTTSEVVADRLALSGWLLQFSLCLVWWREACCRVSAVMSSLQKKLQDRKANLSAMPPELRQAQKRLTEDPKSSYHDWFDG
jgi:hypothetical protein